MDPDRYTYWIAVLSAVMRKVVDVPVEEMLEKAERASLSAGVEKALIAKRGHHIRQDVELLRSVKPVVVLARRARLAIQALDAAEQRQESTEDRNSSEDRRTSP